MRTKPRLIVQPASNRLHLLDLATLGPSRPGSLWTDAKAARQDWQQEMVMGKLTS